MKRVQKGVFLVRKGSCTTSNKVKIRKIREKRGKIRKSWSMTKKRSSDFLAAKNVILVRENFFRPPKLGARFPPLDERTDQWGACPWGNVRILVWKSERRCTKLISLVKALRPILSGMSARV